MMTAHRRAGQLAQHLASSSNADEATAAELYISAFSDAHASRPALTLQQLPSVADLDQALAIGRAMATAKSAERLGGLAGYAARSCCFRMLHLLCSVCRSP